MGDDVKTRIKDLRTDHDLTQEQVAAALDITQRKYSYLEREVQPLTDELAAFYQVSTDYILYLTDKK